MWTHCSPKQIAWAEDLRTENINAIADLKTRTDDEADSYIDVFERLLKDDEDED